MIFEDFDKFQQELINESIGMRDSKGKEYAHDADRFANFRRLSREIKVGCPCCKQSFELPDYVIAWVYLKKHLDSIVSFLNTGQEFSTEPIRGRFVDAITYMTLIAGMVHESQQSGT